MRPVRSATATSFLASRSLDSVCVTENPAARRQLPRDERPTGVEKLNTAPGRPLMGLFGGKGLLNERPIFSFLRLEAGGPLWPKATLQRVGRSLPFASVP
jgi:hypothetical protein